MAFDLLLTYLLQGAALGLTAAASPGPLQTYLISETLRGGWRRGALVSLAPLASDAPVVLVILLLLNQLPAWLLRGVSLVGGVYVLYLAWGMWQEWRAGAGNEVPEMVNGRGSFKKAVLMNLLSPGPYTFWSLLAGPILLEALRLKVVVWGRFPGGILWGFCRRHAGDGRVVPPGAAVRTGRDKGLAAGQPAGAGCFWGRIVEAGAGWWVNYLA